MFKLSLFWRLLSFDILPRVYFVLADYEPSLEERNRTADGADSAQDFRGDTGNTGDERWADPREAEFDTYGVMAATQDSFRRQLLGMRENLQKVSLVFSK